MIVIIKSESWDDIELTGKRWVQKTSYIKTINRKRIRVRSHRQRYSEKSTTNPLKWKKHGVIDYSLNEDNSLKAIRLSKEQYMILSEGLVNDFNLRNTQKRLSNSGSDTQVKERETTLGGIAEGISGGTPPDTIPELIMTETSDFIPIWSSLTGLRKFITTKRNRLLYAIEIIPLVNIFPTDTLIYIKDRGRTVKVTSAKQIGPQRGESFKARLRRLREFQKKRGGTGRTISSRLSKSGVIPTEDFKNYVRQSRLPFRAKQNLNLFGAIVDRSNIDIIESTMETDFARQYNYNVRDRGDRIKDANREEKMSTDFAKWRKNPNKVDMRYIDDKLPKEFKFHREIHKNGPLSIITIQDKKKHDLAWIEFVYTNNTINLTGYFQRDPEQRTETSTKFKLLDLRMFLLRDLVNFADKKGLDIRTSHLSLSELLKTFGSNVRISGEALIRHPHV